MLNTLSVARGMVRNHSGFKYEHTRSGGTQLPVVMAMFEIGGRRGVMIAGSMTTDPRQHHDISSSFCPRNLYTLMRR